MNWFVLSFVFVLWFGHQALADCVSGDCNDGIGTWVFDSGSRYEGPHKAGRAHGKGVLIWADGDKYTGDFQEGKRTGIGLMEWTSGNSYHGGYVDGVRSGSGTYTWKNGDVYEGEVVNNVREGKGKITWSSGSVYIGEFRDGQPTGQGELVLASGTREIGNFQEARLNGLGARFYPDGRVESGVFQAGKLVAAGTDPQKPTPEKQKSEPATLGERLDDLITDQNQVLVALGIGAGCLLFFFVVGRIAAGLVNNFAKKAALASVAGIGSSSVMALVGVGDTLHLASIPIVAGLSLVLSIGNS